MVSADKSNSMLKAIFSKEAVTFIHAKQAWQYQQWRALTSSPFAFIFSPLSQPPPQNPKNTQPKTSDEEAHAEE